MALSKKLRFEVFKRDAFTCRYCGRQPPEVMLHVDHVIPKAEGGPDDQANLVTSCVACNLGKGDTPLGNVVPDIDRLVLLSGIQEALERAIDVQASIEVARAEREAEDKALQFIREQYDAAMGDADRVEDRSLRVFLRRLALDAILRAVDTTASKNLSPWESWKYFCGVCWRMIRDAGLESEA